MFDDKYALHKELGPAFVVVSPGGNDVFVADAEATHDVTKRWKDFVKPKEIYSECGYLVTILCREAWLTRIL